MDWSRRFRTLGLIAALPLTGLGACSDAAIGIIDSGPTSRLDVYVDGPLSSLGAWRYYDGVRLLECDVVITARAAGGSSEATAQWLDGVVDLYDLRTGRYLATDYLYGADLAYLWGDREIESGERQVARSLRYTSYGPYRAYFDFRYETRGETRRAEHRFDCR